MINHAAAPFRPREHPVQRVLPAHPRRAVLQDFPKDSRSVSAAKTASFLLVARALGIGEIARNPRFIRLVWASSPDALNAHRLEKKSISDYLHPSVMAYLSMPSLRFSISADESYKSWFSASFAISRSAARPCCRQAIRRRSDRRRFRDRQSPYLGERYGAESARLHRELAVHPERIAERTLELDGFRFISRGIRIRDIAGNHVLIEQTQIQRSIQRANCWIKTASSHIRPS